MPAQPFADVLEEHWDDLDFLILQRDEIVFDKDYTLLELAEFEERIEAHLDGVRIAGELGREQARAVLEAGDDDGAVQAAARLLSESEANDDRLLEALRGDAALQVARGLRHGTRHAIERLASRLLECAGDEAEAATAAAARDALTFHRLSAPTPAESLWSSDDPAVRTATWESAARMDILGAAHVEKALAEPDPEVRETAFRSLAIGAAPGLLEALRSAAFGAPESVDPVALRMLGTFGSTTDTEALLETASTAFPAEPTEEQTALRNAALTGLGALGSPAALAPLADAVDHEPTREAALDAWARITGLEPDPETASSAQLNHASTAWLKGKNPSAPHQAGLEAQPSQWDTLPNLPLRSRRDLYTAARLSGSARSFELEGLTKAQER